MSNSAYHFWRIIAFSFLCAVFLTLTGCGGGSEDPNDCLSCSDPPDIKVVENTKHIPQPPICANGACK